MLITAEKVQTLKRTNISKDAEKTKQRAKEIWKGLKLIQRDAIKELAGVSSQTIYKVYNDGGISIKLAIAFAQILNISPVFLTGEVDEPGECTDAIIRELLLKHGYQKLIASIELPSAKHKRKYTKREKVEPVAAPAVIPTNAQAVEPITAPEPQLPPNASALTFEEFQQLFHTMQIRAKAGIPDAKEKLLQIQMILLS